MDQRIEIFPNKVRPLTLILGAIFVLEFFIVLLFFPSKFQIDTLRDFVDTWLLVIGLGLFVFYRIRKYFNPRPYLVIDDQGIIEKCDFIRAKRVYWEDITAISDVNSKKIHIAPRTFTGQLIALLVQNPRDYCGRPFSFWRFSMWSITITYGTPVIIFSEDLAMSHQTLYDLLLQRYAATDHDDDINGQNNECQCN